MKTVFAALAALFLAAPAYAQNAMGGAGVITSISPNELLGDLVGLGIPAKYMGADNGVHYIEISEDGAVVYIAFLDCTAGGPEARCGLVQPYGYFATDGVTVAHLNAFHVGGTTITFAMLMNDGSGMIASRIFLQGGVTESHILFQLSLYFDDVASWVEGISPGSVASVSFDGKAGPLAGQKFLAAHKPDGEAWTVNQLGANAPRAAMDKIRNSLSEAASSPQ